MSESDRINLATALLIERLVRDAYADRAPGSVTPLQWAILRAILRAKADPCTQGWISRFVGVTAAPVNRAIKALERHGAVSLRRDENDGRQMIVELTPTGYELLKRDPILVISRRLDRLEPDKRVEFRRVLQQLFVGGITIE